MAKTNIKFNNIEYPIDESVLVPASAELRSHLSSAMNGSGAVVMFDGTAYDIDSTKLLAANSDFVSHLGSISGSGSKIIVNGVEFSVDFSKIHGAFSGLCTHWGNLNNNMPAPDSVEDLEKKYAFAYFSTMQGAIDAASNDTLGDYDADKETAIAGVYNDDAIGIVVVLLKDTEEKIKIVSDMTINLGGHTLSSTTGAALTINSGNVAIDGRLLGSAINVSTSDEVTARAIAINKNCNVSVEGGTYTSAGTNKASAGILCLGNLTAKNATIIARSTVARIDGISMSSGSSANITNCKIYAYSDDGKSYGMYVSKTCTVTASNSELKAYAKYITDGAGQYTSSSMGVYHSASSVLTLNNCVVNGSVAGVQAYGTLYVNGGTYEGYGHGGFYLTGKNMKAYIRNAIIRECDMAEGYSTNINSNHAGAYFGGDSGMTIYIDGCIIHGASQPFVLRGSAGETNITAYISNSIINTDALIRIDNDTHKLYIGAGNNFAASNTNRTTAVIETNETYTMN